MLEVPGYKAQLSPSRSSESEERRPSEKSLIEVLWLKRVSELSGCELGWSQFAGDQTPASSLCPVTSGKLPNYSVPLPGMIQSPHPCSGDHPC